MGQRRDRHISSTSRAALKSMLRTVILFQLLLPHIPGPHGSSFPCCTLAPVAPSVMVPLLLGHRSGIFPMSSNRDTTLHWTQHLNRVCVTPTHKRTQQGTLSMSFWRWDVARSEARRHREVGTHHVKKEMRGIHEARGKTGSRRTQN